MCLLQHMSTRQAYFLLINKYIKLDRKKEQNFKIRNENWVFQPVYNYIIYFG